MATAHFIYDVPERNADLYYATHFRAPDAFIFFESRGKKYVVMSDLELDRARREATVDMVLPLRKYSERAEKKSKKYDTTDVILEVLADHCIKKLVAPQNTPFAIVDGLRRRGIKIKAGSHPFYPERLVKKAKERHYILKSQRTVFAAMKLAHDVLHTSRIKGNHLIYRGVSLSSERLRTMINTFLLEREMVASDTIVACGRHALDPHDTGSGYLAPHQSIVVDIFPRSNETLYYGDATRTFCKGCASDALRKMYRTVKEGQVLGIKLTRAGINGRKIHEAIVALFKREGYETGEKGGRRQGFIHGTGHGIGLEIHEEPVRIRPADYTLKTGNVVSIEPGLYYKGIGGVRIEDLVFVTKTGCEILSGFPKQLEV